MAPLFDSYVVVDWSAANTPCLGKDSIWLAMVRRDGGSRGETMRENLATRVAARVRLAELLTAEVAAGRSVFVGFDFAFGYPQGFAAQLGLDGPPWRATWDLLAAEISDDERNSNNRFDVATRLNRRIGRGGPFWGCPPGKVCAGLAATKPMAPVLAERRITEARTRGTKSVWQLYYNGSVGGQTLMGIPVLRFLRHHPPLASTARIWPFETGLRVPARHGGAQIVLGEIYPSGIAISAAPGQVKDEAQVQALSQCFAQWDEEGGLAALFAGDPALTPDERATVEREEGWILAKPGDKIAATAPARYDYLRNADAIYRKSAAIIRERVALGRFPEDLRPLVLRLVHAAAEPDIADDLRWSAGAIAAGSSALRAGAPLLVDAGMVAAGIARARLPATNDVICTLDDRRVAGLVRRLATTRSAAAVELWRPMLAGAVVAIGNAPTALFHLLEMIAAGAPRPALVLGFPVGFVGAAEAKAALAENPWGLPFVTLAGRRGGSALAAAAVNALAAPEALA
jgi:precorrin-8X/cobalt-precorrin-8 methylmutase